ncbi:MAG: hypothetical protein FWF47_00490 [Clostridia bacterium]|nr:hypothetical protein [Clostridia bacterium]
MDHFTEEIVVKKQKTFTEMMYYLSMAFIVLFGLIAMISFNSIFAQFDVFTLVILLLSAGMAVLLFLRRDRLRIEYEYTFTNGDMDFASVFNNKKRKSLGTMKVRNVEAFGPVNGSAFNRYVSMRDIKTSNWFLNRGANLFFFYFSKDGKKRLIIIEPTDVMVDYIKKYLPRGAWQA